MTDQHVEPRTLRTNVVDLHYALRVISWILLAALLATIPGGAGSRLRWSVIGLALVWPHLARWLGNKTGGGWKSERTNILIDCCFAGLFIAAAAFRLWPATAILLNGFVLLVLFGGMRLAIGGLSLCGVVCAVVLLMGLTPHPDSEPMTTAVSIASIFVTVGFVGAMAYRMREDHRKAKSELRREEQKSQQLLLNVFPRAIVPRLKANESPIADQFADATVLFADVVGYTPLSERIGPKRMVLVLNELFRRFDQAAAKLGVEKIGTIGDGYLAVGGATDVLDDHPEAVAKLAMAMIEASRQVQVSDTEHMQIRVGLHTGPVFGGVIGEHRFHYTIFGETVNVASRIQSQAQPGRVLLSEVTSKRIREKCEVEEFGTLDLKGHGPSRTYWLLGFINAATDVVV